MATAMVMPADARARAAKAYDARFRSWAEARALRLMGEGPAVLAAGSSLPADAPAPDAAAVPLAAVAPASDILSIPLHPPTEKAAIAQGARARAWVQAWRAEKTDAARGIRLVWEERRWPSVGTQELPVRLELDGNDAIARYARREAHWKVLTERVAALCSWRSGAWADCAPRTAAGCDAGCAPYPPGALAPSNVSTCVPAAASGFTPAGTREPIPVSADVPADTPSPAPACAFAAAIRATAPRVAELPASDWEMLLAAADWLVRNPEACCFVRELPVPGIHTKWVEGNRSVLFPLVEAVTGAVPRFRAVPAQKRVHVLDAALAPGGLVDFQASPDALSKLAVRPRCVLACENLTTVLALPPLPGVMAVHGGGYAVQELGRVTWLADTPLLYWGDLDTHGFAILNALRAVLPHARSVLMDAETLAAHRAFCVEEPKPAQGDFAYLTSAEREVMALLGQNGARLRLEQERISWDYALSRIRRALEEFS